MKSDIKLIMVSAQNNNKFYNMHDNGNETFTVEFGRIGVTSQHATYPIQVWDRKYREKTKKGYRDVTDLSIVSEENEEDFIELSDSKIAKLVDQLQSFANKSMQSNYTVSYESVTEAQVNEAQLLIDDLVQISKERKYNLSDINSKLIEIYTVIPRRMSNVKNHLFDDQQGISFRPERLNSLIDNEQSTLDVMRGQVATYTRTKKVEHKSAQTILDTMGISILPSDESDVKAVQNLFKTLDYSYKNNFRVYKVENENTRNKFSEQLSKSQNDRVLSLWHGSRNENWWSILGSGLSIRPAGAILTGSMFGYGLYFADKAQKSIGYSSLRGSYWASGNSNKGFLAVYEVHLGNSLHVKRHEHWMYDLDLKKLKSRGDYDSLFAEGGVDLRNNEYIIYHNSQCTIKYLVEFGI